MAARLPRYTDVPSGLGSGVAIVLGLHTQAGQWGFVAAVCPTLDVMSGGGGSCPGPSGTWEPSLSGRRPVCCSLCGQCMISFAVDIPQLNGKVKHATAHLYICTVEGARAPNRAWWAGCIDHQFC